ncbi:hypothetical protein Tco_1069431, partial [Tanacetum coccineum]
MNYQPSLYFNSQPNLPLHNHFPLLTIRGASANWLETRRGEDMTWRKVGATIVGRVDTRKDRGGGYEEVQDGSECGTRVIKNTGNAITNQANVIRCYNCKGEVHIARQCTQAKKAQNSERFKDKMLLAQAQEVGVVMDEEQLAFLADNGEAVISRSPQARAVFMENLTPAGPIYDADTSPSYDSHI